MSSFVERMDGAKARCKWQGEGSEPRPKAPDLQRSEVQSLLAARHLDEKAENGGHRHAAVLQLGDAVRAKLLRGSRQVQRIPESDR